MIFRDATLLQVTQSVTRNGKSIMLTMMLALILIYLFSVVGFIFFRDDFLSHIQTGLFSSYSSHRYRRTNPSSSSSKTSTLTRRSTVSSLSSLFCLLSFDFEFPLIINDLLFFILATTIPDVINNGYCTKENCSNETLTNQIRQAAQASTILPEEVADEEVERSCDTLFMCIVTTLNKGLRNGGGIGDVLRQPSSQVRHRTKKTFYE